MIDLRLPGEGASDDEVRDFVQRLHEGAEIGKAIATRRARREHLGDALDQWVDLAEDVLSENLAREALRAEEAGTVWEHADPDFPVEGQKVDRHAWRGVTSGQSENDLAAWLADGWPQRLLQPSHQQDRGPVLHLARRIVEAALDHMRGIALLLADRRIMRPPFALARVVLDGTAHACYLLEPGLAAEERLIRALNETLARASEDYNEAARDGNDDRARDAEAEITAIFDAVGDRRPWQWNKDRRRAPFIGEKRVSTAALTRLVLDGGTLWNQLSGVVHLKEDEGWRIMLGVQFDNPHVDSYMGLHTFGAVLGLAQTFEILGPYTGWDLGRLLKANGALCSLWADGSGMRDDVHRAAVLAERGGRSA